MLWCKFLAQLWKVREHLQLTKLRDIKANGVKKMATTCPKCQIHFTCFLREKDHKFRLMMQGWKFVICSRE